MRILIALLLVSLGSVALWAAFDRPLDAPDWKGQFRGISYSPSHIYSAGDLDDHVTDALIRDDLEKLLTRADAWRDSPEHCAEIFRARTDEIGIGFGENEDGSAAAWVVVFGELRHKEE